jgi:hypothetical protein
MGIGWRKRRGAITVGDITDCDSSGDEATAKLVDQLPGTIATLGDNVYPVGHAKRFAECYISSWGQFKARTRPTTGNHEYEVYGAAGYFTYFGAAAGNPATGYYSYDLSTWHIVVLNSNCDKIAGGCQAGSPQDQA